MSVKIDQAALANDGPSASVANMAPKATARTPMAGTRSRHTARSCSRSVPLFRVAVASSMDACKGTLS